MCVKICPLSSGSRGNSVFVGAGDTKILIDNGLPVQYIENALMGIGVKPNEIDAVLVTHRHTDHVSGLGAFSQKYNTKVFAHHTEAEKIAEAGRLAYGNVIDFFDGDFYLKDLTVSPFRVDHDAFCLGYSIYKSGTKVSVVTDLGHITPEVLRKLEDSDVVMIEANHDDNLLFSNDSYSPWLKRRIKGPRGHLSNAECARACAHLVGKGVREIILAHLSEENNYPELAFSAVCEVLSQNGITEGCDVKLTVAKQHIVAPLIIAS